MPLETQSLRHLPDQRKPLRVLLGRDGATKTPLEVGPGRWALAWPGYVQRAFRVEAGNSASIRLETVTGRCERTGRKCSLNAAIVSRTASVSVR